MVVEDQYLNAIEAQRLIEALGGRILGPAPTVRRAMALLETSRPDLALLDVNLGDESVFPLADGLSERGVPFVFVSGYENSMIPENYRSVPCLTKPLSMADLVRCLGATLKS